MTREVDGPSHDVVRREGEVACYTDDAGERLHVYDCAFEPPFCRPHHRRVMPLASMHANHRYFVPELGVPRVYRLRRANRASSRLSGLRNSCAEPVSQRRRIWPKARSVRRDPRRAPRGRYGYPQSARTARDGAAEIQRAAMPDEHAGKLRTSLGCTGIDSVHRVRFVLLNSRSCSRGECSRREILAPSCDPLKAAGVRTSKYFGIASIIDYGARRLDREKQ